MYKSKVRLFEEMGKKPVLRATTQELFNLYIMLRMLGMEAEIVWPD